MDVDEQEGGAEGESQASQLLRNALASQSDDEMDLDNANTIPVDEPDVSKDLSSSDSTHSQRTMPHYHYHGLATTQTQSQQDDDEGTLNEGSQKENVNSSREPLSPSSGNQIQSAVPVQSPIKPSKVPLLLPSKSKAVSFESPIKAVVETPTKPAESRYSRSLHRATPARKRDASQDSFAGDFEDPAQKYIASIKQLDIPLAELGRAPSPSIDESGMEGAGTILVDDTPAPSVAGGSQSQSQTNSQDDDNDFFANMPPLQQPEYNDTGLLAIDAASSQSSDYQSSEPTSSYRAMYDNPARALEPTQTLEATQILEETQILEPTQILTQILEPTQILEATSDAAAEPTRAGASMVSNTTSTTTGPKSLLDSIDPRKRQRYAHTAQTSHINTSVEESTRPDAYAFSNTTSTTTGPRSLLDSIDPRKRERYAHAAQTSRISTSAANTTTTSPTVPLGWQDTQPAFEPVHSTPVRAKGKPRSAASRPRRPLVDDRTEIVPDSEPPRESTPSPAPPPRQPARSPVKPRSARSSDTETDGEVVPDSTDVKRADLSIIDAKSLRQEEEEEEEEEEGSGDDEDEDDEEEIPSNQKAKDLKGKGKAVEMGPPPTKIKTEKAPKKPLRTRRTRAVSPSVVPSSVPNEDLPPEDDVAPMKRRGPAKAKRTPAARGRNRKVGGTSTRACAKNINYEESSEDDAPAEEELAPEPTDEEVPSESADDEEYGSAAGPSNRKRKRGIKVESPSFPRQPTQSRRGGKATRQIKRARGVSGSGTKNPADATRVFALWRPDGNFYSGFVYSMTAERYMIHFDDQTTSEVKLDQMRSCTPKVGDMVLVPNATRAVNVTSVDLEEETVTVRLNNRDTEVHFSKLKIAPRAINSQWNDRLATADSVVCQQKSLVTPLSEQRSISRDSTSKSHVSSFGLFSRTGFCMTQLATKDLVEAQIKSNGGEVIDDWECVLGMKGERKHQRWILNNSDIGPTDKLLKLQRVFLLADAPSHTLKYLLALALGIPCLKMEFIQHAIETGSMADWNMYLLSSGYSGSFNAQLSQFVLADWGKRPSDLQDIMSNPTVFQGLKGKTILGVLTGDALTAAAAPKIMLAMGAKSVEAVSDLKHASSALVEYDYIVVTSNDSKTKKLSNYKVVSWDWVKDALISRRFPPLLPS